VNAGSGTDIQATRGILAHKQIRSHVRLATEDEPLLIASRERAHGRIDAGCSDLEGGDYRFGRGTVLCPPHPTSLRCKIVQRHVLDYRKFLDDRFTVTIFGNETDSCWKAEASGMRLESSSNRTKQFALA
jgi:hypothetical protein